MNRNVDHAWLPQGWTLEVFMGDPDIVVINRPRELGGGMTTMDFRRRVFSPGYGRPHFFPRDFQQHPYKGRGWKRTFVGEACAWLEATMKEGSGGPPRELAARGVAGPMWPMAHAPRNTPVLLRFRAEIPSRPDMSELYARRWIVGQNRGDLMHWSLAGPFGCGGFPDDWFEGWQRCPRTWRNSMVDRRKLLAAAALAGDIEVLEWLGDCYLARRRGGTATFRWNSLTDDGDTLRLAIAVGIALDTRCERAEATARIDDNEYLGQDGYEDHAAAVRMVVTRAAAQKAGFETGELEFRNGRPAPGPAEGATSAAPVIPILPVTPSGLSPAGEITFEQAFEHLAARGYHLDAAAKAQMRTGWELCLAMRSSASRPGCSQARACGTWEHDCAQSGEWTTTLPATQRECVLCGARAPETEEIACG
ncbi:hypothetical protein [Ramlibacter sp. AN1133]|uniref:hypothetical protein n=1 Tax=Ramlibacter sp. AN1133 TaxID=3133429 RepID=UPI0030C44316